jgi:RNA polymerase sigma-70 factor (ECF subfamily)
VTADEEKELLKLIKKDPQAFAILYDNYYNPIFSYVFRRLGNYDLSKDITAETFLKAYQKIGSFVWRGIPVSAWFYRIASNEINLFIRQKKYSPEYIKDTGLRHYLQYEEGIETEKAALEKAMLEHKQFSDVRQQLALLNLKYQEVIALRFFEEKPIKEIALILAKNEGTVKSLLSRGLVKLRTAMGKK